MTKVNVVTTGKDLKEFINFPYKLYAGDKNYVPDLKIAQKETLDRKKNPFFKHSEAEYFFATDDQGKVIGRIAAITNENYVKHWKENYGFFGFFDCIDDMEVSKALFDAATGWLKEKGVKGAYGPMNPSTNDTCGTLVDGFDTPPYIMMVHNKTYYDQLIAGYGFKKRMDLLSYRIVIDNYPKRYLALAESIEERLKKRGIVVRPVNFKDIKNEAPKLQYIYNKAWEKNWGFIPMSDEEFQEIVKELKMVTNSDLVYIAEDKGKPVAFVANLPDINEITIHFKEGKLFPFNFLKLLNFKKKVKKLRVLTMGLIEEYRNTGIDSVLYNHSFHAAKKYGYTEAEASWILENNVMMNRILKNIGGDPYKRYRIYGLDF